MVAIKGERREVVCGRYTATLVLLACLSVVAPESDME